ncbi:deleted in malignant brain tumors 1 protein-like [Protopterus annectens]|uniref:deleted in malignant brain tumors 1 protein-like n=1 Tax=Protopterus annectens TaxID=7888 RepID=UPI001CFA09C1|nr:deleted in malignant brain tumors 1 protein-like [Protopterus annectens]XP_043935833.1 deleted in malignant brain tumors 1 protein-like [Protopterus annectens]
MESTSQILITVLSLFASIQLCTSGNITIRLADGFRCSGRLEIYSGSNWKSVCSTNLNMNHARVACRQLSCGVPVSIYTRAYFGASDGENVALNLQCNRTESALSDCSPSDPQIQTCSQAESINLECSGPLQLWIGNHGDQDSCAGVVYVSSSSTFGYISGEGWNIDDANVVCRLTGCGFALSAASISHNDLYYNSLPLNLGCLGTEYNLEDCPGISLMRNTNRNSTIGQVVCSKDNLSLRLVNGSTLCSGRLEVYNGLSWVTVCRSNWTMNQAKAVCAQLGCGFPVQVYSDAHYGQGYGDIFPRDVLCSGNETSLMDCDFTQPRPSSCTHDQDVSIICSGLRLANGPSRCSGLVEVNDGSQWGSVCSTDWDIENANVICRHLRCGSALSVQTRNLYGESQGPVLLDGMYCNGSEKSLSQCSASQFGSYICDTLQVAAVECSGEYFGSFKIRMRAEGSQYTGGQVEIYSFNQSTWGTISGRHWDINDAQVLCKSLEYGFALAAYNSSEYLRQNGPVWFEANCYGNEIHLSHCPLTLLGPPDLHTSDAAVLCTGYFSVRIVNGTSQTAGNVEISYGNTRGSISTEGWDIYDANVVCRSERHGFALAAVTDSRFGAIFSSMWFKDIQCSGAEYSLSSCSGKTMPNNINSSSATAAVICSSDQLIVRLVNGTDRCNGILEVNRFSSWEPACSNDWYSDIADAVCNELYCGKASSIQTNNSSGYGQEGVWLNYVECYTQVPSLSECSSLPWNTSFCDSAHQVHITCSGQPFLYGVKLSGFPVEPYDYYEGFSYQSAPCSSEIKMPLFTEQNTYVNAFVVNLDIEDANTVCRQRRCGSATAVLTHLEYGRKSASISFQCTGHEMSLSSCPFLVFNSNGSQYWNYATVICSDPVNIYRYMYIPPLCISIIVLLLVVIFVPEWRCRTRYAGVPEKY